MAILRGQQLETRLSGSYIISGSTQELIASDSITLTGNVTASGVVKADAFESVAGGTTITFNDDITIDGNVSSSSTKTGSFGHLELGNADTDASFEFGRAHIGHIGFSDMAGFSHVDLDGAQSFGLAQNSSGKTIVNAASGQQIALKINNADKVSIDATGLSIGTDTPAHQLHVVGNAFFDGNISGSSTSTGSFGDGRFKSKVGIGLDIATALSTPHSYLDVRGNNVTPSNGNGSYHTMQLIDTTAMAEGVGGGIAFGGKFVGNSDTIFGEIRGLKENGTSNNYAGALTFQTRANGANLTEQVRIDSSGNLAVGTSSPSSKLHVVGDGLLTGDLTVGGKVTAEEFHTEFVSSSIVFVSGSSKFGDTQDDIHNFTGSFRQSGSGQDHYFLTGNVGIGSISPARKLEIKDTSSNVGIRLTTGTALDAIIDLGDTGDADIGQIRYDNNTDKMHFRTNANDRVTIDSSGRVGIGTTSPSDSLTIVGSVSASESGSFRDLVNTGDMFSTHLTGSFSGSFHGQAGARHVHSQATAASTWSITHALGVKYPNVTVYDGNDQIVIPTSVTATNANQSVLTFSHPISGIAMFGVGGMSSVSGRTFIHSQGTAGTNWYVTHSLGEQFPAVTVYDDTNSVIIPERILAVSPSTMELTFQDNTSGNAHFSVGNGLPGVNSANAGKFMRVAPHGNHIEYVTTFFDVTGSLEITGSITLTGSGSISGSSISTGSFGHLIVDGNVSASGVVSADAFESRTAGDSVNFADSVNVVGSVTASGAIDAAAGISGSSTSTGSFGRVETAGGVVIDNGNVSGSVTSTGSFGRVEASSYAGVASFSDGTATLISGSAIGTGSFGSLKLNNEFGDVNIRSTGGSMNIVIGDSTTGESLNSGAQSNVLIGQGISAPAGASNNVFVGDSAGAANAASNNNVAIGYSAMAQGNSNARTVAIGFRALNGSGNSNNNVAVGSQAGEATTDGEENVFIGQDSGDTNTTGDKNITLGNAADVSTANAQNQIAIGHNVTSTGDNQTVIGNSDQTHVVFGGDALISGSSTSTGSFGRVEASTYAGVDSFSDGTASLISGSSTSTGSFGKLRLSDSLEVNTTPSATAVIHSGGDNGAGTGNTLKIQTGTKNLSYASYIELEPNSSGNIVINPRSDELELYGRLNFYETYDISTSGFNDLSLTTRDGSTPWTGYGDSAQIIVGTNTNAGINLYTHGTGLVYISGSSAGDKLEVVGGIKATGNISGSSTSTGSFGKLHIQESSTVANTFANDLVINRVDKTTAGISILTSDSGVGRIYFGDTTNQSRGYVLYDHNTDILKLNAASGNRLTLTATIAEFETDNYLVSGSSTSTGSFGSLSLGESSHIHTLSIKGQSEGSTGIRVRHPSDDTLFEVIASEDDGRLRLFANNSRKIQLHANDVSYFNGGDVGIGTESPQKDLHLHQANSNTLFEALTIRTNSAGEGLTLGINSTNDGFITSQVGTALRLAGDSQSYATGHLLIYSGSGNIEAVKGNISGSATSTGSIAVLNIGGTGTTDGGTIFRAGETQVAAGANVGDAGARYVFNVDTAFPYVGVGIMAQNHNPHHLAILNSSFRSDGNFNYAFTLNQNNSGQAEIYVNADRVLNIDGDGNQTFGQTSGTKYAHISGSSTTSGSFGRVDVGSKLFVNSTQMNVPDYVFESDYKLKTISNLETHISQSKHLPGVPSRDELELWTSYDMANRDMLLLEKIEELTLYTIQLNKRIEELERNSE